MPDLGSHDETSPKTKLTFRLIKSTIKGLPSPKDQEVEMRARTTSATAYILSRGCARTMYVRAGCSSGYGAVSGNARQCAAV